MNISDLIGKGFERVLRWVYPSLLFAALALAGHDSTVLEFWRSTSNAVFISVVVSLAAGAAIYMAQRYVIHDCLVKPILYWFGWAAFGDKHRKVWPVHRKVEVWADWLCKRFGATDAAFSDYLMSRWANIHVMGLTAWVLLLMFYTSDAGSFSRKFQPRLIWAVAAAFLVGHLWETILTERMERQRYETQHTGGGRSSDCEAAPGIASDDQQAAPAPALRDEGLAKPHVSSLGPTATMGSPPSAGI